MARTQRDTAPVEQAQAAGTNPAPTEEAAASSAPDARPASRDEAPESAEAPGSPPAGDEGTAPEGDPALSGVPDPADQDEPVVTVTCHRPGGCRRGGRFWPHGRSVVALDDLPAEVIGDLRQDHRFSVVGGD